MIASYPAKFFSMLEEDAIKREKPLLTRANCYITLPKWKPLPIVSKVRYFRWLIEEGELNKNPVPKDKAMKKLEDFFFVNYDIYKDVRNGLRRSKDKVYIFKRFFEIGINPLQ